MWLVLICLVSCCLALIAQFNRCGSCESLQGRPEGEGRVEVVVWRDRRRVKKGNVRKLEVTAIVGRCERQREKRKMRGRLKSAPCPLRKKDLLTRTFTSFFLPPPTPPPFLLSPIPPIRQILTSIKGPHRNTGSI